MKPYRTIPCILITGLLLSGCTGYVGGDLKNTRSDYGMPTYKEGLFDYSVKYTSDAEDDYCDQNIAGFITGWTLGIIPTYWMSTVHSEAVVFEQDAPVYTGRYKSRIHKFYGIPWALILPIFPHNDKNALAADEGGGLRVEWGIRDRTLRKVMTEHGGKQNQYGLIREKNP